MTTRQRKGENGVLMFVHHGYAKSTCRHRTKHAMTKCAERTARRRERDKREATR